MLRDVGRVFAQPLLQPLHKVHQILKRVLLITDRARVAGVIHDVGEDLGRVHVALIRVEKPSKEVLQLMRHFKTDIHPLGLHLQLLILLPVLFLLLRLPSDGVCEDLFAHVWQEEEGLDEGVEVASVSNILEAHRHTFRPLPLVQSQWLRLQARLNRIHQQLVVSR